MLFTTVEPMPPRGVLALIHAVHAVDAKARVHLDATRRQARIDGRLTVQEAAAALQDAGLPGVVTDLALRPRSAAAQDSRGCSSTQCPPRADRRAARGPRELARS